MGQLSSSVLRLLTLSVSNVVDRKQMEANGDDDEEQKKNKVKKKKSSVLLKLDLNGNHFIWIQ